MAICIFLTSFVIKLHYSFCLIISVSLNVPDHVSPAAFMSRTCQIFFRREHPTWEALSKVSFISSPL